MLKTQLDHRTIRFYKDKAVEEEKVNQILEVINRTATSNNLQSASVIRIKDQAVKDELSKLGKQDYIANVPELFIFIVDHYRNASLYEELTGEVPFVGGDLLVQGMTDAVLMAQNAVNACESLGLGTVYFGSILNDAKPLIELLELPKYTMPILGLGFGYSNDDPELKPRLDIEHKLSTDKYEIRESYTDMISTYDVVMTTYYDTRNRNQRSDSFSSQIQRRYQRTKTKRDEYFETAIEQGFQLDI